MKSASSFISVICLVLSIMMLVAGFAVLAVEPAGASTTLHQARVAGDDRTREAFETQQQVRVWQRRALIGGLFAGSGMLIVLAFLTLGNSGSLAAQQKVD